MEKHASFQPEKTGISKKKEKKVVYPEDLYTTEELEARMDALIPIARAEYLEALKKKREG